MIIWRGFGIVVFLLVFGCAFAGELLTRQISGTPEYWEQHAWPLGLSMLASTPVVWLFDKLIRRRPAGGAADVECASNQHALFFIPVRFWPAILTAIAIAIVVFDKKPGPSRSHADADRPAAVAVDR